MWIAFVSSFDTYLTVHLKDSLKENEQNPIARLIMTADNWNVSMFIGLKMFGTIFSLGILVAIFCCHKRCAFSTIFSIAIFQTLLLLYLLYDHRNGIISFGSFN